MLALSSVLSAQTAECTPLVEAAIADLQNCADADGNTACFASSASATSVDGGDITFNQSGDMVDLSAITSLSTQGANSTAEAWGLALANVHANIPLSVSRLGLKFVLVGDVQVENTVDAASAALPAEPISVTAMVAANLRSSPSTEAQVLLSVPVGTELQADGLSQDSGWLRVLHEGNVAWVSRQIVAAENGAMDTLPIIGSDNRTLMQAFKLNTGIDMPDCQDGPPSMLVVQGPEGVNANIIVNGANIRFNSTIGLHLLPENILQLIVFNGSANVGSLSVPAGFLINIPLSADGQSVSGPATGLRPVNDGERGLLSILSGAVSPELLYSPINLPTAEEITAMIAQLNAAAVGQTTAGPAAGNVDCSRFKPTSPLGSLANGVTPFYWDAAAGATSYRLNIYGEDGGLRGAFEVSGSTTLSVDTGAAIGSGSNFSWSVEALVDGQVACTSGFVSLPRDVFQSFVGSGGGGGATPTSCTWSC
jgi:hypothetical protein